MTARIGKHHTAPASRFTRTLLASSLLCLSTGIHADASGNRLLAPLKDGVPYAFVVHNGRSIRVERDIDQSYQARPTIMGSLRSTAEKCPPFCLLPMQLDIPVSTVGEVEIVDFMQTRLRDRKGVLVDVRSQRQHRAGTIPGSINFSIARFNKAPDDPGFISVLEALGAKPRGEVSWFRQQLEDYGLVDTSLVSDSWDFSEAKDLILWSDGPMDDRSAKAAVALANAGYPTSKMAWYRGGMPAWQYWGFNTVKAPKRRR